MNVAASAPHTFTIGEHQFLLDGKFFQIRCGEIHFARVPQEYWRHRLQMCRAMGLNAVCVYLFWNLHEWEEGTFDWTAGADAAEFCRIAQQEGLWVLLRPGPYSCAEWEMGGLPWWLVKHPANVLRTSDPAFLEPATRFLREVGRVLAPLQVTRGGPLLMVQVENEYGSFGADAAYMGALRQSLIDGGFNVPLFACNPAGAIANGFREDLFQVVNFGPGAAESSFEKLRKFQKTGPLMNGEYYPAWFDMWGTRHKTGTVEKYLGDLESMTKHGMSFSIYMAHGGTSFGLWSGADRPFRPDTSSYDYDAPISEAGHPTEKFRRTREMFAKYLLPGETIPDTPAPNPIGTIARFAMSECAPVLSNLPEPVRDDSPKTMEFYGQGRGCIAYRTTIPPGTATTLSVGEVHDFAWLFLDGKPVGVMDRRGRKFRIELPARDAPARLDILIEAVGRVNFGTGVYDRKGLHAPVKLGTGESAVELKGWEIFRLPLDEFHISNLEFETIARSAPSAVPTFWRGRFRVDHPADTFLDLRTWGKGVLWMNGVCLGRFWNIGPTQTMYCPGVWLKAGVNEVVILDLIGPTDPALAGLAAPILDELRPALDFARRNRSQGELVIHPADAVAAGEFTNDVQWQAVPFERTAAGRYFCFEALGSIDGKPLAAVSELELLDCDGNRIGNADWKIIWVSSEELADEAGDADNVLDGQPNSFWHTAAGETPAGYPHRLVIDFGATREVGALRYLPRAGGTGTVGRIKGYRVYVSPVPFGLPTDH